MRKSFLFLLVALLASPSWGADAPPTPTAKEQEAAMKEAGGIECWVNERFVKCSNKAGCLPGRYSSRGHTRAECTTKVLKLCKELCEGVGSKNPINPPGECVCGPVTFTK